MHKKSKINKKQSKGITLIALVITIIVLLILAGVTINTLFDSGNVMEKASEAKEATEKGNFKEQLELAVITSRINDDNVNLNTEKLKNELDKLKGKEIIDDYTTNSEGNIKLPCTVKNNKWTYEISEDGVIEEILFIPNSDKENQSASIITNFGTVDIIWLKGKSNTPTTTPNVPILQAGEEALTPVKFVDDDGTWIEADKNNSGNEWYNYTDNGKGIERETQETDSENVGKLKKNNSSKWANAKTRNDSYFVWIPRYAYRITYYESETSTEPTGYYDGFGMWNADGELKYELDKGIETILYDGKKYIVHPAFMKDIGIKDAEGNLLPDYERGGWSDDLEGFWFAKFEMGGETAETLNSQFGSTSIREQNIGTMYENARNATFGYNGTQDPDDKLTSFMHSHMVKNSEWGAVAYLTHSKYGLNGREITINNNGETYYRGGGTEDAYIDNTNQSTTGNAYGIYDMSGNAYEYISSYNKLSIHPGLESIKYGGNLTKYAKDQNNNYISTKYITAYYNDENVLEGEKLYDVGKVGDGTKETYLETGSCLWFKDYSHFPPSNGNFFVRGGWCTSESSAGIFYSSWDVGSGDPYGSFRVSLCP